MSYPHPPSGLLLGPILSECQKSGSYPCLQKETYHNAQITRRFH